MIVFFDLWLTVRNPFYAREKRVKYYWAFLIIQTLLVVGAIIYINHFYDLEIYSRAEVNKISDQNDFYLEMLGVIGNINYVLSFVSIFAVLIQISRPGTSKEMKSKVCRRYFSYLSLFLLWIINFNINFFTPFDTTLMILGALLGIPIAFSRLLEPLVWQEFKKTFLCKKPSKRISKQQDSLCSFLKSKMNVELVYITLVGICQFYGND